MNLTQEQLKAHLMETDPEFRRLAEEHCGYKKQLQDLASRAYLTPEQQVEETRIKKLKLRLKDQMQEMMYRYRHEHEGQTV
jgi:uncharacterized protein YdcH (DUF465 family)